jgi:hypothetical protein
MVTKAVPAAKKAAKQVKPKTQSVTLRISTAHLAELDALYETDGVLRSGQIQRAIGEYLERRRK